MSVWSEGRYIGNGDVWVGLMVVFRGELLVEGVLRDRDGLNMRIVEYSVDG